MTGSWIQVKSLRWGSKQLVSQRSSWFIHHSSISIHCHVRGIITVMDKDKYHITWWNRQQMVWVCGRRKIEKIKREELVGTYGRLAYAQGLLITLYWCCKAWVCRIEELLARCQAEACSMVLRDVIVERVTCIRGRFRGRFLSMVLREKIVSVVYRRDEFVAWCRGEELI